MKRLYIDPWVADADYYRVVAPTSVTVFTDDVSRETRLLDADGRKLYEPRLPIGFVRHKEGDGG